MSNVSLSQAILRVVQVQHLSYYYKSTLFNSTKISYPISCHWSLLIPPENIREPLVFRCFQGVSKRTVVWNGLIRKSIKICLSVEFCIKKLSYKNGWIFGHFLEKTTIWNKPLIWSNHASFIKDLLLVQYPYSNKVMPQNLFLVEESFNFYGPKQ